LNQQPTRRQLYDRSRRRRAVAIAATSTVIVIAAVIVLVPLTPGWQRVRRSFFDGDVFADSFPRLLDAFWLDIKILL
jgi:polar amino acid transport system permease protein